MNYELPTQLKPRLKRFAKRLGGGSLFVITVVYLLYQVYITFLAVKVIK
ncbi:MAG TPA: hypothetical protein VLF39_01810 [Candidatus Saccharimonadales bacterium]|nr:hypothetical protein [Candidatus Saccharimonadales bacterium]